MRQHKSSHSPSSRLVTNAAAEFQTREARNKFREAVLAAWGERCIVCGDNYPFVSAAHLVPLTMLNTEEGRVTVSRWQSLSNYTDKFDMQSHRNGLPMCGSALHPQSCHWAYDHRYFVVSYSPSTRNYSIKVLKDNCPEQIKNDKVLAVGQKHKKRDVYRRVLCKILKDELSDEDEWGGLIWSDVSHAAAKRFGEESDDDKQQAEVQQNAYSEPTGCQTCNNKSLDARPSDRKLFQCVWCLKWFHFGCTWMKGKDALARTSPKCDICGGKEKKRRRRSRSSDRKPKTRRRSRSSDRKSRKR